MKRINFVLSALAILPTLAFGNIKSIIPMRTKKGFKVKAGEARSGKHYKMKGVTQNILDIKISGKDTEQEVAMFEQTGLSPNGGPPLHIHPFQDEWFYVIEGEYLFQVGENKYKMTSGDTIFLFPVPITKACCTYTALFKCGIYITLSREYVTPLGSKRIIFQCIIKLFHLNLRNDVTYSCS